jgi:hypothetical protein
MAQATAQALPQFDSTFAEARADRSSEQLGLYGRTARRPRTGSPGQMPVCAGCREKEARYGFRDDDDPAAGRPRALCFGCFRVEIGRRQAVAARMARGWNAQQVRLPLEDTLRALSTRRRRAQIAARHALEIT